ncbi:Serine/Threonine kinase domain protein (macronuclear) [Tetrahymena thermophila SB210]|uniref:Serine/Threonine kinase domain protein n=1 Tax=Tetrahymena thermophila (strain SB210) TaxID=312017 RepID=I7M7G6_TETTS|nr:Serine/Threonine kinase domain protein [Tetrahymena thermophila SB210]EAR92963.2 Serine/Threonine kinase domain protein [Tetrahymena thermophila SB210]|eukprot:XP_001013208.2 Serine/Threonine kinase domain protein [Tetrahymena thermophila SB210]
MATIHLRNTFNHLSMLSNDEQQTTASTLSDSKINSETFLNQNKQQSIHTNSQIEQDFDSQKVFGLQLSPMQYEQDKQETNFNYSSNIEDQGKQKSSFNQESKESLQKQDQQIENKSTEVEEEEQEEDEDDFPAPRQKSNTFTSGYISTHVPCESKKSRFGFRLNLNIRNPYNLEDSDIMDPEIDSSNDYDSTDDSLTNTNSATRNEFAKRRSSFFKSFKPESLRLITCSKNEIPNVQQPSIIKKEKFEEKFHMHEKLGEGCHSIVRRCQKKEDSPLQSFAVKIISYKDPEYLFEILQEERVLSLLSHKNIIKYDSFFLEKDKKKAYIVSEYAQGKPLGYYIQNKRQFSMREIASVAKQTLKAIAHMHSKGIIHRDLSYNNIMYDPISEQVKVIDFTVSKIVTIQKLLTNTGTLNFKAPEMLQGQFYSHSIDIFSLGVNLFALIFGYLPFQDNSDKQVISNIINHDPLEFYKNQDNHDPLLLHFLESLLEKDPLKRLTALQALKHPWINQKITGDDLKKIQKIRKSLRKGISASTVAELDDLDQEQDTITSFNQFMVKTLINLQDD